MEACLVVRNKHRALGEDEGSSRKKRKNTELKMNNGTERVKWGGEVEDLLEEWLWGGIMNTKDLSRKSYGNYYRNFLKYRPIDKYM